MQSYRVASLTPEQMSALQTLERELHLTLVAYEPDSESESDLESEMKDDQRLTDDEVATYPDGEEESSMFYGYSPTGCMPTGYGKGAGPVSWPYASAPYIGAQAGANDLAIGPGFATYPSANATIVRIYEYAVPVTTVATVPSAIPAPAGLPGFPGIPTFGSI